MKLIRHLWPILNLLAILVIMASPVLAFLYSATYTVTNNSTVTAYTMLPVSVSVNNTYLAANGYMESTSLDTRVETAGGSVKPHLVADNKTLTAVPAPVSSQTNLRFTTGNSDLTSMDIITGYGGYVTVTDAAALEPGASFQFDFSGYVDTSTSGGLATKDVTYRLRSDGSGNVLSEIYSDTTSISGTNAGWAGFDLDGNTVRVGQRLDAFPAAVITNVQFYIGAVLAPAGIATVTARKVSDDSIIGTFGTIDVTTIGAGAWYSFGTDVVNGAAQNIRIQVEYVGTATDYIRIGQSAAITGQGTYYIAAYTDIATDASIRVSYSTIVSTLTAAVTTGEHVIRSSHDGTTHKLFVDDLVTPADTDTPTGTLYNFYNTIPPNNWMALASFWGSQSFNTTAAYTITYVNVRLYRIGAGGTVTARIRAANASDEPTGADLTSGTFNAAAITEVNTGDWYKISLTPYTLAASTEYTLVLSATTGVYWNSLAGDTGGVGVRSNDAAGNAPWWNFDDFLYETYSTAVPNTAYDWILMSNATPYADYYQYTVGGTLTTWYQPVTIVNTTVLPDRQGAAQNGIITWGSNPATVNVAIGSLVSSGQSDITDPTTTTRDILGEAEVSNWFTEPDVSGTLASNPFRPFVTILSDTTSLTERQAWIWLALAVVLGGTVFVGSKVKGHHIITGVVCGVLVGVMVQQTIFPFYAVTFIIVAIFAGVMAERKRQI